MGTVVSPTNKTNQLEFIITEILHLLYQTLIPFHDDKCFAEHSLFKVISNNNYKSLPICKDDYNITICIQCLRKV